MNLIIIDFYSFFIFEGQPWFHHETMKTMKTRFIEFSGFSGYPRIVTFWQPFWAGFSDQAAPLITLAKRCQKGVQEKHQKVTFFSHFWPQEKTEKTRKDTLSRLFCLLTDSGGPSLPSGSELARKQQKTALFLLFPAVLCCSWRAGHAQWPGHALGVTFDASFQKSKMRAKIRFIWSSDVTARSDKSDLR